jgi:DNA-binding PadR family transcriptional regulator
LNFYKQENTGESQEVNPDEKKERNSFAEEIENRIVKGFLDLIVLIALKNQSGLTGYDLMMHVHRQFGTLISSGTIYSVLYSLERKDMIKGTSDGRRTSYLLTQEGDQYLKAFKESKDEFAEFMAKFLTF